MKRRVGAVLVRDKRVLSTGYNGTPRGMRNCNEGGCGRCNGGGDGFERVDEGGWGGEGEGEGEDGRRTVAGCGVALDECLCLHAEENALLEAGRERLGDCAILYCNTYVRICSFPFPIPLFVLSAEGVSFGV